MYRIKFTSCAVFAFSPLLAGAEPALDLERENARMVPLFEALPVNECMVTAMVRRQRDGLIIGATCGKKEICLFSFDLSSMAVKKLDCFEALWWDEPRLALGPEGDIYLGARRAYDKQFFFERQRQRPHIPGTFRPRDSVPPPHLMEPAAPGMPIRHYSPAGLLLAEIALPEFPEPDGVGALAVDATGQILCGLTAPGGRLFTVALSSGQNRPSSEWEAQKDYGEVIPLPQHHHTRPISKVLLAADNGKIYLNGTSTGADDDIGRILELDPLAGVLKPLDARLPAVVGRRRFAAIDAAVKLDDGSFLAGTTDGYLFRFDPKAALVEGFGKPLRQHRIPGLARGVDGLIYGVGGEEGGLPRLFAFDPVQRRMHLGTWPGGMQPEGGHRTFGDIGAVVSTADGTLICGERERRGYLLLYYPKDRPMPSAAETKARYTAASATPSKWKNTLAGEALTNCTRDRFVDFSAASGTLGLAPTYLIADAMARSSKISELLTDEIEAKKVFELPSAVEKAEILFFGGGGSEQTPMLITVNGHEIHHVQDREKMLTGGWDREIIPGHYLQRGSNELIFSGAGFLLIDADRPGKNSFKRLSAESNEWKSDILGPENNLSGEYVVRIRVHGYPPEGTLTSPIIDMAAEYALPPKVEVSELRLSADLALRPQTAVQFAVRTGSTAWYAPDKWSPWRSADPASTLPGQRFVQWRATLSSRDVRITPLVKKVTIEASGQVRGVNHTAIEVIEAPDNAIAVSSYDFDYADPHHPRMRHLREKYRLEEIVAPGKTEMEKFALLRQWVRQQWEGWNENEYNYCPQWDALEILELAPQNLALGMCTHYAAVFAQCAAALGYHTRPLIVDHHCLAEIWSDQHGKWILQDPGLLPGYQVAFQYERAGVPINALEMHLSAATNNAGDIDIIPPPPIPIDQMRRMFVDLYLRFGIPLRNDHLYHSEPQELEQGMNQYHWDGHLWWTDSLDPRYPEYSLQTTRPEDFYWSLNKTKIDLEDTETTATLSVQLSGPIPNFARFEISLDEGAWQESAPSFEWKLRPGRNTLRAKAVNTMSLQGPVNQVVLKYHGN